MSTKWFDEITAAGEAARQTATKLRWLSESFDVTGNTQFAGQLRAMSIKLDETADLLHRALGAKVAQDVVADQRAFHNTMATLVETVARSKGGGNA